MNHPPGGFIGEMIQVLTYPLSRLLYFGFYKSQNKMQNSNAM